MAAVRVPELFVTVHRRAVQGFAKLALAVVVAPEVSGSTSALSRVSESVGVNSCVIAFANT